MAVINGTNGPDDIFGTASNDTIAGFAGDDYIEGRGGNDLIYGGAGNDDILGGIGANDLYGGTGTDWFVMSARGVGASDDYIADFQFDIDRASVVAWGISDFSQIQALLQADANGDAFINGFYNGYNHFLTFGNTTAAQLAGVDFVFSNSGAVSRVGTNFNDTLFGSRFNDSLNGAGGNDKVLGGIGNDTIFGGAGNDQLFGGAGADSLSGGANGDFFMFRATSESISGLGVDRITDFQEDIDRIHLSIIDARLDFAGNQAFTFVGSGAFTASGQLRYYFSGNDTVIAGNTDFDATPELQIILSGRHVMIGADFYL